RRRSEFRAVSTSRQLKPSHGPAVLPSGHSPPELSVIPRLVRVAAAIAGAALFVVSTHLSAQEDREKSPSRDRPDGRRSLDLGVNGYGISFGDSRRWTGLRFNYRDSRLDQATGINATLWYPYEGGAGRVSGLALGLPTTGATELEGFGIGVFGFG